MHRDRDRDSKNLKKHRDMDRDRDRVNRNYKKHIKSDKILPYYDDSWSPHNFEKFTKF